MHREELRIRRANDREALVVALPSGGRYSEKTSKVIRWMKGLGVGRDGGKERGREKRKRKRLHFEPAQLSMKNLDLFVQGYGTLVAFFPFLLFNVILSSNSFFKLGKKGRLCITSIYIYSCS